MNTLKHSLVVLVVGIFLVTVSFSLGWAQTGPPPGGHSIDKAIKDDQTRRDQIDKARKAVENKMRQDKLKQEKKEKAYRAFQAIKNEAIKEQQKLRAFHEKDKGSKSTPKSRKKKQ